LEVSVPKLNVVICSTRPGRVGKPVGDWFAGAAKTHGKFDVELVDLADMNLPLYDEPKHPRLQQYEHDHTKRWAASVDGADAFVFVTPEYNFGPPPSLVNALNYVYLEWNYKPAGFVSYGGVSGGMRAVQTTKLTLTTLKMMPMVETVLIPTVPQHLDKETGAFGASDIHASSATAMLDELLKWAEALRSLRGKA
jgi:NAD(P)H-dependent FMN reductase